MYKTIIIKNSYKDSIVLMLLTNEISGLEGVNSVSIMMATEANKGIFEQSGMLTQEVQDASPNDIAIVIDATSESVIKEVLLKIDEFLNQSQSSKNSSVESVATTWNQVSESSNNPNIAVLSVPGVYAAYEGMQALKHGMNVFMFSDNVSLEDERKLKEFALSKGLMVMGPDCGTGIINNLPIAFTNEVNKGSIGIVGASGTGIQEVTTIIDKLGHGVTSAIGTGGRDLYDEIGGITMIQGIKALKEDEKTKVIVIISKPASKTVMDKVMVALRNVGKPIVTIFLGNNPSYHEENIYNAKTLYEAAFAACLLDKGESPFGKYNHETSNVVENAISCKTIRGLYSGGTLASEAKMIISDNYKINADQLESMGHLIMDLGDDKYTQGKPHPMIDPEIRIKELLKVKDDHNVGVILLDVVLGYGSHADMASELAPTLVEIMEDAHDQGRKIDIVATVCGTRKDRQDFDYQVSVLENIGVSVCSSNEAAVLLALNKIGIHKEFKVLEVKSLPVIDFDDSLYASSLINDELSLVNVGVASFYDDLKEAGGKVMRFEWKPVAGGNLDLMKSLTYLNNYSFERGNK